MFNLEYIKKMKYAKYIGLATTILSAVIAGISYTVTTLNEAACAKCKAECATEYQNKYNDLLDKHFEFMLADRYN